MVTFWGAGGAAGSEGAGAAEDDIEEPEAEELEAGGVDGRSSADELASDEEE
jgi:hypothetical protein